MSETPVQSKFLQLWKCSINYSQNCAFSPLHIQSQYEIVKIKTEDIFNANISVLYFFPCFVLRKIPARLDARHSMFPDFCPVSNFQYSIRF